MMSLSWSGKQQYLLCKDLTVVVNLGCETGHLGRTKEKGKVLALAG